MRITYRRDRSAVKCCDIGVMFTTHHSRADHPVTHDFVLVIRHGAIRRFCHSVMLGKVDEN